MRGTGAKPFWGLLLVMILALGTLVLAGCSDDNDLSDSDTAVMQR